MNSDTQSLLERILQALPMPCQQRLLVMGWEELPHARDPARFLLRAVGAAQPVHLIDLELEPARWHGRHVVTHGEIQWPGRMNIPPCVGKLRLDTSLLTPAQLLAAQNLSGRSRLVGVLMGTQDLAESRPTSDAGPLFVACLAVVAIGSDAP